MPIGRATTTSKPVRLPNSRAELLGLELGFLIDVAGIERRILVRRRIGDVPVHAAGAAVHHAPGAAGLRRFEHVARAVDVDGAIRRVRLPGFAIGRGDVIHDVDALGGAPHRGRDRARSPSTADHACRAAAATRRTGRGSCGRTSARTSSPRAGQRRRQVSTGEAGRAGHQDLHRRRTLPRQSRAPVLRRARAPSRA